ncbi:MAG: sugar ABC transporter permease [Deltaproteobacteria bacterium]|nr:sugar ABC transporter permease [Deltaproteobacteria bacterium]
MKNTLANWLGRPAFILPALIALLLFSILPSLCTVLISLTDWKLGQSGGFSFVGVANYLNLWADPDFGKSLRNTLVLLAVVVPVSFILALSIALAIIRAGRFGQVWQTIYFLPVTASLVAMAVVWQWVLHPEVGLVAFLLSKVGIVKKINWLNDGDIVLFTIAFITIWQMTGYYMVLFLTGLLQIPTDLYEAARIDGARSGISRFLHITWPLLGPTSLFVFIITIIKSFQVFDIIKVLTRGGPEKHSEILLYTMYQEGFAFFRTGTSAAIASIYLSIMLVLIFLQIKTIGRKVHYGF